jgi:glycosyltransferase involved in cell wall biosynthesis
MKRPLVSTITPCYRMGRYLRAFLESLPRQTYFSNIEVVLDHNEPEELEIQYVRDFQKAYPGRLKHIVVNKVDPIGVSMNRCIREASGEYLVIWNVDDLRTSDSIETQVNALLVDGSADIVYGDYVTVTSFGATDGASVRHEDIPASEFTRSMIFGPFFMFRRSLCQRAGQFDEQLRSGADFDLAVRLAFHGNAVMAERSLGFYLNEGRGASTRPNSLQPIERTVVELRYGIYDKIDYSYLPEALKYEIHYLSYGDARHHVSQFVPHYDELVEQRKVEWFARGIRNYCVKERAATTRSYVRALKKRITGT